MGYRRVPPDKTLAQWVRELERSGKRELFYATKEWKQLRAEVLHDQPLCQDCLAKSPAEFSRAVYVHHVNELHDRPDLGLTRQWVDATGQVHDNLVALCMDCHEARHNRFVKGRRRRRRCVTEERFD